MRRNIIFVQKCEVSIIFLDERITYSVNIYICITIQVILIEIYLALLFSFKTFIIQIVKKNSSIKKHSV